MNRAKVAHNGSRLLAGKLRDALIAHLERGTAG